MAGRPLRRMQMRTRARRRNPALVAAPKGWPIALTLEAVDQARRFTAAMTGEWPVYDELLDTAVDAVLAWVEENLDDMPNAIVSAWEAARLDGPVRAYIATYYKRA